MNKTDHGVGVANEILIWSQLTNIFNEEYSYSYVLAGDFHC